MSRFLLILSLVLFYSLSVFASNEAMPPKNPKAQTISPPSPNSTGEYGDVKFSATEAKMIADTLSEGDAVIIASVAEVCPKKGCWMNIKGSKPSEIVRVTFKDYGFFVPTELNGKEVALSGRFIKHVESVEEQKHLLMDAKRPQSEIDAIVAPKETFRFVANGVKDLSKIKK